mgnify:FL=1
MQTAEEAREEIVSAKLYNWDNTSRTAGPEIHIDGNENEMASAP